MQPHMIPRVYLRFGGAADGERCAEEACESLRNHMAEAGVEGDVPEPSEVVFISARPPTYLNHWDGGRDRWRISF